MLVKLRQENISWRSYRFHLINENKWRAVRHGLDGQLIDCGQEKEVPMRFLALELLDFIEDVVEPLGIEREVAHVHTILKEGTSADRQLAVYRETGDLTAVVDHLIEETCAGLE